METPDKKTLRAKIKQQARQMDPAESARQSELIMQRLEALPRFAAARTVALYWPLPGEPDTRPLIRRWASRKRIVLPVVDGNDMFFREYTPGETMAEGAFGIGEPAAGNTVDRSEIDLVVVPGVAFSRGCGRLGRGKGFYDRFLSGYEGFKAGICFEECVVESMACDFRDVDMDIVITLREIFVNSKKKS